MLKTAEEYYDKGVEYGSQGRFKEAEEEFKKALEIDQFYIPAKGCLELTEDLLAKRVEDEAGIHLFKGVVYGNKGTYDEAILEYKKEYKLAIEHCDKARELGYSVNPEFLNALEPYRK